MGNIQVRTFSARLDCHYFLLAPDAADSQSPLALTLHGFGANPRAMLHPAARLFERQTVIAPCKARINFSFRADTRQVGYGWITNSRPVESIRLHHEMVLQMWLMKPVASLAFPRSASC
jgi:hypothetical protein